jgi:hypothetical protein
MPTGHAISRRGWLLAVAGLAVGTSARRAAAWAAVVALLAGSAMWTATGRDVGRYGSLVYGQVGQLLAQTPSVDTVAAADIGRLGWYFPGAILDLGALTDARLTHGWDDAYVTGRDPDVLLVVASGAVPADLADPDGLRHFEAPALDWARRTGRYRVATVVPLPGGTVMSVLRRDDVAWPAEVWGL